MHNLSVISSLKMSGLWIAALSMCLIIAQTVDLSRPLFISVKAGEHTTVKCPFGADRIELFSVILYKQIFGEMPRKLGEQLPNMKVTITPEFQTSGYTIEATDKGIFLTIQYIKKDHGGLYYCERFGWKNVTLSSGTFLTVTDDRDVEVSVIQSNFSDSVPAGSPVTLQCSVLSDSKSADLQVLWFRAAPAQSHPQIIYTHHNSSRQCESYSNKHTCVYNFSKKILNISDTGTYYCAVAMCGKIIFGSGTQVQLEKPVDPVVISLAVILGVCVVVIFALIFVITYDQQRVRPKQGSVRDKIISQDGENVELNYAALHFSERTTKRGRGKKHQPQDIIYSDVRCPSGT